MNPDLEQTLPSEHVLRQFSSNTFLSKVNVPRAQLASAGGKVDLEISHLGSSFLETLVQWQRFAVHTPHAKKERLC